MSFQIVGDDIYYDREKVATLCCDRFPTVRDQVVHMLTTDIDEADNEVESLTSEVNKLEDQLEQCEQRRDALAAILGVDP